MKAFLRESGVGDRTLWWRHKSKIPIAHFSLPHLPITYFRSRREDIRKITRIAPEKLPKNRFARGCHKEWKSGRSPYEAHA